MPRVHQREGWLVLSQGHHDAPRRNTEGTAKHVAPWVRPALNSVQTAKTPRKSKKTHSEALVFVIIWFGNGVVCVQDCDILLKIHFPLCHLTSPGISKVPRRRSKHCHRQIWPHFKHGRQETVCSLQMENVWHHKQHLYRYICVLYII